MSNNNSDFYAVIPAGGSGTRLWPLSRKSQPKFLFDLVNSGETLIEATYNRLQGLVQKNPSDDRVLVVTGESHIEGIKKQLVNLSDKAFITEPSPKDSMAAIGLAAAVLQKRHGDVIMGSFAADQLINGVNKFTAQINDAIEGAKKGFISVIGITTSIASTAFGYIESGERASTDLPSNIAMVTSFTEKPDRQTAQKYIKSGNYYWNAGMFVAKVSVILDALQEYHPTLFEGVMKIAEAWDTEKRAEILGKVWNSLEKIAIDYAIIEPLGDIGKVIVVPATFAWNDIGDFDSLGDILGEEEGSDNKIIGNTAGVIALESDNNVVYTGTGQKIALMGVDDFIVVNTEDVLMIAPRSHAQNVKQLTEIVERSGNKALL